MLSRWFPTLKAAGQTRNLRFRQSLVRSVLLVLLLTSLFPVLLIGGLNTVRSRQLLREQANQQTERIVSQEVAQIDQYASLRDTLIDRMVTDQNFNAALNTMVTAPSGTKEHTDARALIMYNFHENPRTAAEGFFDQIILVRPDSFIALATSDLWVVQRFGGVRIKDPFVLDLMGTDKSVFQVERQTDGSDLLMLYTARSLMDAQGNLAMTLIASAKINPEDLTFKSIANANAFLPGAVSYYFTPDGTLYRAEESGLGSMTTSDEIRQSLAPLTSSPVNGTRFTARIDGEEVITFAHWMPNWKMGVLLAVSESALLGQNNLVDPFNIALLLGSLLVSGGLIYFGSTRLVRPLVRLATTADNFSKGQWDERAPVTRSDELGLLAYSFNNMADQLQEQYRKLESEIESRTSTLRVASEVAQMATSTTKLGDTLRRTVELIAQRFDYYHVAVYLYDALGQNLILREASGAMGEQVLRQGDRIPWNAATLLSQVAATQQPKIITNVHDDPLFRPHALLPATQCQIAIPIVSGDEALGVLEIQSTQPDAFDSETSAVFQTLANQISSTLQASRLLESTEVSYQETSVLYRATRQVTEAKNEDEILQALTDAFSQLPYISAVLSLEGDVFKIQFVTDPKTGQIDKSMARMNIPVGEIGKRLESNRVVLLHDLEKSSEYDVLVAFMLRRGCKSAALVSVIENGRLSKVIILSTLETNQITQTGLQPYVNLATVIGANLEKQRLVGALQMRLSELQVLTNVNQAISAETDLNHLYQKLHHQIIETFGENLEFAVAIYDQPNQMIAFPYFCENGTVVEIDPVKMGQGLTSQMIQSHQPLLLSTPAEIARYNPVIQGQQSRTWMGVPLIFAGEVVGALILQDLNQEHRFDQNDLNLMTALAPQIATSVRNTQLYTETQQALRKYDQERFLLNTLLENMPEGISFKDPSGKYIRASHSAARVYRMEPESMIGQTNFDLLDAEHAESIHREEQRVIEQGTAEIGLIMEQAGEDGKTAWLHTSRIPIRTSEGDPYGLLIIERDVTELKVTEALAQKRAGQVLTAAEIAREATGTLDLETLLQKSINLVRERFGFYHASIFMLDAAGEYAVLRESTGTAGAQMKKAGHRLSVGSKSIVGRVTASGEAYIVNDVLADPTHLVNPLLPETRSELAIPLKVGDRILGALDVQSTLVDGFNNEDVGVLAILADQLAAAVVNSQLFAKTQELLGKHRLLRQVTTAASTSTNLEDAMLSVVSGLHTSTICDRVALLTMSEDKALQVQTSAGYESTRQIETRIARGQGITGQAAAEKRVIRVDDTFTDPRYTVPDPSVRSELAIPILFSETLIGVLNLESARPAAFDENDQEILGALGSNLGGVMANIRLVSQVRQQVIRERQLFDVTSKVRRSVDLGAILEISAKEIAQALGARRASIRIQVGGANEPAPGSNGNGHKNGSNGSHPQTGEERE